MIGFICEIHEACTYIIACMLYPSVRSPPVYNPENTVYVIFQLLECRSSMACLTESTLCKVIILPSSAINAHLTSACWACISRLMHVQGPVHLCGSVEHQCRNSFAYIYCEMYLILSLSSCSLPSLVKNIFRITKKAKSFGKLSKIEWSMHQCTVWVDHIRVLFVESKMLQVRFWSCFPAGNH